MAGTKVPRRRGPKGARRLRCAVPIPNDMISRHLGEQVFRDMWLNLVKKLPTVEQPFDVDMGQSGVRCRRKGALQILLSSKELCGRDYRIMEPIGSVLISRTRLLGEM